MEINYHHCHGTAGSGGPAQGNRVLGMPLGLARYLPALPAVSDNAAQ